MKQEEEGLIFLYKEIQTSKNISQGKVYWEISIEALSINYIPVDRVHEHRFGQDSTVVLSFRGSPCNDVVCLVCLWAHQLEEELLKCPVVWPWYFVCYAVSIIAGWSIWKWCRREFRRYDQCLQWGREVFNACVRKWRCIGFQRWSVVWVFYISVLGCCTRFSSVGNWKIIIDC